MRSTLRSRLVNDTERFSCDFWIDGAVRDLMNLMTDEGVPIMGKLDLQNSVDEILSDLVELVKFGNHGAR